MHQTPIKTNKLEVCDNKNYHPYITKTSNLKNNPYFNTLYRHTITPEENAELIKKLDELLNKN